ncbi:hypothetical protein CEE37_12405 [candidate division LCP-89 bacterium B3_LCP]|uniref:Peptidase C1A papain C-terminal domain-containing protein n=1 Tax=candidate division LCP-89 bacterium B3_LCP TaxID=2012998 RepID=A0A532UUE4_UNCL8|nr:MAG: hypothetical protein CEE37_12405 [candidate division LCP-89 bacterium B3_LCP]
MYLRNTVLGIIGIIVLFVSVATVYAQPYGMGALREYELPDWIKPSPIQPADYLDESCDLSPNFPPVGNQGGQGSCTAFATAYYYKSYQEWQEHGWDLEDLNHRFSPAFVYNQINGGNDVGSYPSDAFLLLTELGCASWAQMPYTDQNCTTQPNEETYYTAIPYRSQDVYYIDLYDDLDVLKNHLLDGNAAAFAFSVYDNFNNISNFNNIYCASQVVGTNPGGHCVTFCGFDDSLETADGYGAFKVANSWGSGWGDGGYFWITYQAVQVDTITWQWGYYCTDRTDYQPTVLGVFRCEHDDRYACQYQFGIGDYNDPLWSEDFFDWYANANTARTYPASNIVIDLTDGVSYLDPLMQNQLYMRVHDRRTGNNLDGQIIDFTAVESTWPASNSSLDPPVPIPDDTLYAYATLEITQGSGTTILGEVSGTWSPENNPYYVMGDITIPEGSTLTIEPGTQVMFLEYGGLNVENGANLQAVGTTDDPILFSPLIYAIGWHGIRFDNASDASRIEYCNLRYGKAIGDGTDECGGAIFCSETNPMIVNNNIEFCTAAYGGAIFCLNSNPEISSNTITFNTAAEDGGGIYLQSSNPNIIDNTITDNHAYDGAAIYNLESSPQITDNTFTDNNAEYNGGAVLCSGAIPQISTNSFSGNEAGADGGAILGVETILQITENVFNSNSSNHGGAISCLDSDVTVESNQFQANTSMEGGAIYGNNGITIIDDNIFTENNAPTGGAIRSHTAEMVITSNTFDNNTGSNGGAFNGWFAEGTISENSFSGNQAIGSGGAIFLFMSDLELVNNLIAQNNGNSGGGIYLLGADPVIINNTICNNTSLGDGGGIGSANGSDPMVMNSIIYGNSNDQIYLDAISFCTAVYCDVDGGWEGMGNIDEDPAFLGAPDYHLTDDSPCLSAGNTFYELGGNSYSAPEIDIEGNPRPNPAGSDPDMGAYEMGPPVGVAARESAELPDRYSLYQNAPNPFNPVTVISFDLPVASFVELEVFDISGRNIGTSLCAYLGSHGGLPLQSWYPAGKHEVTFNGSGLASGIYIYRIQAGSFSAVNKMVLVK